MSEAMEEARLGAGGRLVLKPTMATFPSGSAKDRYPLSCASRRDRGPHPSAAVVFSSS